MKSSPTTSGAHHITHALTEEQARRQVRALLARSNNLEQRGDISGSARCYLKASKMVLANGLMPNEEGTYV